MSDQLDATPFDTVPATPVQPAVAPVSEAPVETVAPVADQQPAAQFQVPEALQGLIGEGMKYATPEAALQSVPHAQHHIERLEQELADTREDLSKRKAVEDVLAEINKTPTDLPNEPQLTQEQLDALIDNRLATKEAMAIKDSNTSEVVNKFIETYGDKEKAMEVYHKKAADLGIPVETINNLTATSPKAVFELFGIKPTQASVPTKINSNFNSEAVVNQNVQAQAPKSVMGRSTHKDDINAWNAAAPTE